jgi:heme a synthase
LVAFALAMLGSWTRINGAGMTCPDWPLCHGEVVPVLRGGVVLEWFHRLLAFIETFVVASLVIIGVRLRSKIPALGGMLAALAAVFVLQVLLGGATIFLANSPLSVMFHWGTAMLLLAVLVSLAVVAFVYDADQAAPAFARREGTAPLFITTGWAFITMCAGAYVSTSGAGLACLSVPGCGPTFFGGTIPQALQMTHRFLAAALVLFAITAAVLLPRSRRRPTVTLRIALVLLTLQIVLGVLNVLWLLPTPLREAHAANAIAAFLAFVVATVFASLEEVKDPLFLGAPSQV